jgi:hypothetical protein
MDKNYHFMYKVIACDNKTTHEMMAIDVSQHEMTMLVITDDT